MDDEQKRRAAPASAKERAIREGMQTERYQQHLADAAQARNRKEASLIKQARQAFERHDDEALTKALKSLLLLPVGRELHGVLDLIVRGPGSKQP